tara:strand:- start:122 stop:805 length:684 start_codon:yes stop_codon:yes gene_type:complete
MREYFKKIPVLVWVTNIISSIKIIIQYSIGINVKTQDERANPSDAEWENNPWAIVFKKRSDFAKSYTHNKNVLDLCCGTGWTTFEIGKIANQVIGVDYSDEALEIARRKYGGNNITYKKMNALALEFSPESFDSVVSMEAIEHFTQQDGKKFISEAYRVLKKRGIFLGSTPQVENRNPINLLALKKIDPFHLYLYSEKILENILLEIFNEVEVIPQKEGWLLFIARK